MALANQKLLSVGPAVLDFVFARLGSGKGHKILGHFLTTCGGGAVLTGTAIAGFLLAASAIML